MSREIFLTQGKVALVDDDDYERISQFKWYAHSSRSTFYAQRNIRASNGRRTIIKMHRVILSAPDGVDVDHLNRNGLDNSKQNLRLCTDGENKRNRGATKLNTSGYKGVTWHKQRQKWKASISVDRKSIHLGLFSSPAEAARAYDAAAIELHGEFACLNFQ